MPSNKKARLRCFREAVTVTTWVTWVVINEIVIRETGSGLLMGSCVTLGLLEHNSWVTEISLKEAASRVTHEGLKELLLRLSDAG